jgi:hypothetical protein
MSYELISVGDPWELGAAVSKSISEGYVPYGQPFNNTVRYNGTNSHTVCQAMIKPNIIESLELMEKIMKLHPQLEEHLLKGI